MCVHCDIGYEKNYLILIYRLFDYSSLITIKNTIYKKIWLRVLKKGGKIFLYKIDIPPFDYFLKCIAQNSYIKSI